MGICSLTLADWPEASVAALFYFFIDVLSTVFVPLGRGRSFPAASQWVWAPCTHPVAGSCPAPASCLSRAWSTWQVGLPSSSLSSCLLSRVNLQAGSHQSFCVSREPQDVSDLSSSLIPWFL